MTANFFKKIKDPKAQSRQGISAIEYLLNDRVEKGTARILKGNPELTKSIISNIRNKQKATVGCLSFTEKDLKEQSKYEVMEDFENMLFPGISKDDYNILWIEHTDKHMIELNFVIPKIHLSSQKALQPYYFKQDQRRKDLWQQKINHTYNLTNPLDRKRERTIDITTKDFQFTDYKELDIHLNELVNTMALTNRDNVITYLKENNINVTRTSKDSISVKLPNTKKARRFKGIIYSNTFTSLDKLEELKKEKNQQIIEEKNFSNSNSKSVMIKSITNEYLKYLEFKRKQQSLKYSIINEQTKEKNETKDISTTAFTGLKAQRKYDKQSDEYYQRLQLKIHSIRTITIERASTYEQTTFRRFEQSRTGVITRIKELVGNVFNKLSQLITSLFPNSKSDTNLQNTPNQNRR